MIQQEGRIYPHKFFLESVGCWAIDIEDVPRPKHVVFGEAHPTAKEECLMPYGNSSF